jgi:DNA-binding PadR family transcriptional regulator
MAEKSFLGEFELLVLLAVLRLANDAYGVPIAGEIQNCTGREVALGSVYGALERLELSGLVCSRTGESTPERGGRAKRYFTVTKLGLQKIRHTQAALTNLWRGVRQLKGLQI